MDELFSWLLQQAAWAPWILIGLVVVVVAYAVITRQPVNLFDLIHIGSPEVTEESRHGSDKSPFSINSPATAIASPSQGVTQNPSQTVTVYPAPQMPVINQTFYSGPHQLPDEQYQKLRQDVLDRLRAERPAPDASRPANYTIQQSQLPKLEFKPLELPERVVQMLIVRHTIEKKLREVFGRTEHFMMMGVSNTSRYLEYGTGVFPKVFYDLLPGLDWELNHIIYAEYLDDEQFERAQIVASEVIHVLESIPVDRM